MRTAGLVAGVIGVLVLAAGLIADSQRPPREVTASSTLDTPVVVYEPAMLAFLGDSRIGVSGEGAIVAVTAVTADAHAWLSSREATVVTGLPEWEVLSTADAAQLLPTPEGTSPSPSPSPTPSPTPSPGDEDEDAEADPIDVIADSSSDHWREEWRGDGRVAVRASDVPAGETLLVMSRDGSPLALTDVGLDRDVNDRWITPLIWWGVVLTAVGLVALILRFIDMRPWQARGEEWIARRQRDGDPAAEPRQGGRRARRATGELLPEADLDEAAAGGATTAAPPAAAERSPSPSSPEHGPEDDPTERGRA